jgi:small GTP-binding protein
MKTPLTWMNCFLLLLSVLGCEHLTNNSFLFSLFLCVCVCVGPLAIFLGVDFKLHNIKLGDKVVRLHVWDTAGQERYRSITSSYYRNSDGILLVFDMTNPDSLAQIERWVDHLEEQLSPRTKVMIVGNKCDEVGYTSVGRIKEFARSKGHGYKEVSAKSGEQVQELFMELATSIKEYYDHNGIKSGTGVGGMRLGPGGQKGIPPSGINRGGAGSQGSVVNKDKPQEESSCCS